MTVAYKARVWEVGTITGAGPYNLPNVANAGAYRTVAGSGLTSGQSAIFCLQDTVTNVWELSLFNYTSGSPGTLTRVQFLESSTGSAVTFAGNSTNITLEIPSPVLSSAGSTNSGLLPALNTSGVLDSSFISAGGSLAVYTNTFSGSVTFPNNPALTAVPNFVSVTIPASSVARVFEISGYIAINASYSGYVYIAPILDPGASASFASGGSGIQINGVIGTTAYGGNGSFAGQYVTVPGDGNTHVIAIGGGQYGSGSGTTATSVVSMVARQIS